MGDDNDDGKKIMAFDSGGYWLMQGATA